MSTKLNSKENPVIDRIKSDNKKLVEDFANGDLAAFKVVFAEYYPALCYFSCKILNNTAEAEDLVMEVFTKLWEKRNIPSDIKNISPFLYKSVKNACLDLLRKQERISVPNFSEEKESLTLQQVLEAEEVYAGLLKVVYEKIEELPSKCKQIFKMLYLEGKSTQEVSEILGLSVQSVRNQKTRALSLLRIKIGTNILSLAVLEMILKNIHSN